MCERDLGLSSILGRAAVAPTSLQGAAWVGLPPPPQKPPPESHRRLLGLPDGISSLLPFAVGPPARSQQLPAEPGSPESLCAPRSIPTACPREGRNRPSPPLQWQRGARVLVSVRVCGRGCGFLPVGLVHEGKGGFSNLW